METALLSAVIAQIEIDLRESGVYVEMVTVIDGYRQKKQKHKILHPDLENWLDKEGYLKGSETNHAVIEGRDTTVTSNWDHWYFDFIRLHLTVDIVYDYLIAKNLTTLEFIEE